MLKGNRFLIFILLILLNFFIIYIICKKVKYYEEEFTQMISVHNTTSIREQTLYNFNLNADSLVIDNSNVIQQLNNFIALFPINDNNCVALDNKQQMYLITKDETSGMVMNSMSVSGKSDGEYPVKIVSYINGSNYELYLLTSYGKIYSYNSLNNDRRFGSTSYDNAIDICCTSVMIYLNNRGEIKNGSMTVDVNKYYVQIISYDNTSSANTSGKSLFGLCTDGHIYDILSNTRKTEEPIESLNVKLICNDEKIGYINNNSLYYATTGGEMLNNTRMILDVKDALFINDTIVYKKFSGDLYKFVSDNGHQQLTNGNPNIFSENPLFTGVSPNSLFVMSTVSTIIQIPITEPVVEPVVEVVSEPVIQTCDITNDDPSCNEIFESLTAIIDNTGECDTSQ